MALGAGLLIDSGALEGPEDGPWKIKAARIGTDAQGRKFVERRKEQIRSCGRDRRPPLCSAVLMRSPLGLAVATAGHCTFFDQCVLDETAFVLGLTDVEGEIGASQRFRMIEMEHYEDFDGDRDLAIIRVRRWQHGLPTLPPLPRLANEAFEPTKNHEVLVSGHPRGRALSSSSAVVMERVPKKKKKGELRGMNLLVKTPGFIDEGLSGAPVYDETGSTVVGIFQGAIWAHLVLLRRVANVILDLPGLTDGVRASLFRSAIWLVDLQESATGNSLREDLEAEDLLRELPAEALGWLEGEGEESSEAPVVASMLGAGFKAIKRLVRLRARNPDRANATFLGGALSSTYYKK